MVRHLTSPAFIRRCAVICGALTILPSGLSAQLRRQPADSSGHGSWVAVGASLLAVGATLPLDGAMRSWLGHGRRPEGQEDVPLAESTELVTPLGTGLPFIAGSALYGIARLTHHPTLADAVWHTGVGALEAAAAAGFVKIAVRRTRPYVLPHDPDSLYRDGFWSLGSRWESFPSGHTTVAFAVAAGATEEMKAHWPKHARLVGAALYTLAGYVAFARVYDDVHWTSDVVAGAALGTLMGRRAVRHPDDSVVSAGLIPGPGVGFRFSLR